MQGFRLVFNIFDNNPALQKVPKYLYDSLIDRGAFITVRNCIQILFCHTTTSKEFQLSKKWKFALSLF